MKKFNLKKIIHAVFSKKKKNLDPNRDWKVMFVTFCLLTLIILGYGIFNYWKIEQGTFFNTGSENTHVKTSLDTDTLKNIRDSFDQKAVRFQYLKSIRPDVSDPSQ